MKVPKGVTSIRDRPLGTRQSHSRQGSCSFKTPARLLLFVLCDSWE